MGISIDTQEGGPIEGIFGSQVEQRLIHHIDHDDDDFGHARRPSEGRESMQCNTDLRGSSPSPCRLTAPSPRPPANNGWLRLPWNPWRRDSPAMPHAHRPLTSPHPKHNSPWWRPAGVYDRLPLGISLNRSTGGNLGMIQHIQGYITGLVAAVVSSKRRKGWFLGLILVSLALTVFSGGYLMNQLQYRKDISPPAASISTGEEGDHQPNIPITTDPEQDSGPRKDRDRSKKPHGPKRKKKPPKPVEPAGGNQQQDTPSSSSSLRICNLADVAKGQWVFSQAARTHSAAPRVDQDMSWTGYGPSGCRSNIWNERYLLTPASVPETELSTPASNPHQFKDWPYAEHLQQYHWQMEHSSSRLKQKQRQSRQQGPQCRQLDLDLTDFVEVLKRSPLVMIGDKFLEQEFLVLECMLMGMQQQLLIDYRTEDTGNNRGSQEELEALDYWIESEKPAIIELKVASGERLSTPVSPSESSAEPPKSRSIVYRKAKPGQMKLFDRQSNLTLVTFIRSDVLWDSGMLTEKAAKHALKSAEELSTLDAGGLHPDCKFAGTALMCEPAGIDRHESETKRGAQPRGQSTSRWWRWLMGSEDDSLDGSTGHNAAESADEEMSTGSDLDHDMINLEWVETLKEIVEESATLRHKKKWGTSEVERRPMVLVSNGRFWEYDPRDAVQFDLQGDRKLSKAEQDKVREKQDKRKSMLRQRYTIVLTNLLDYIKTTYPDLRVIVQTSVSRSPCEVGAISADEKALWKLKDQEAALLNALTKTVVARMQDPLYSFLDTTFLRIFKDSTPNKRHCRNFMMPGPLDTLVKLFYGELYRLDL